MDDFRELDECRYLFLSRIDELGRDGLRLLAEEGRPAGEAQPLEVGGVTISGGTAIEVTAESRRFTLQWPTYVAYAVLNESFANPPGETESYEGRLFRRYTKSYFADYVSLATFAAADYPGPTKHFEVCCLDHVVEVISTSAPLLERVGPDEVCHGNTAHFRMRDKQARSFGNIHGWSSRR